MRPIRNSAKTVILRDRRVLAIGKRDEEGMYYILPGGGQLPGETLHEALRRECLEEIDVEVMPGDILFIREYIGRNHEFAAHDGDVHQIEFMFACQLHENAIPSIGPVPDEDQLTVEWLPVDELERYRLYPASLCPLLRRIETERMLVYMGDIN